MNAWRTNMFLSISKWGWNHISDLYPQRAPVSNFPPPPHHPTPPRLGLTVGAGRGAEARAGHSFCQGQEPLLKTTPNAKHHQLFCEFYRNHKYYIVHRFSSASPGSRCYTHSNTVIRQTRPGTGLGHKNTATHRL